MARARRAFIDESGAALCKKWSGVDALFAPDGFAAYAGDLLERMVNPFLTDRVDRVCRDLDRKLGWDDRLIGTMRLCLSQQVSPNVFAQGAALAACNLFGNKVERGIHLTAVPTRCSAFRCGRLSENADGF